MKVNTFKFLLFILASLAPLPIFFDLGNLSIIFAENINYMEPPLLPLPISLVIFLLVFFQNLPLTLNKLSYRNFNLLLFFILLLSFITIVNGVPITRLVQFTLPLSLILSIPALVNSFNIYIAYAFVMSLSTFSIFHLIYNFININNIYCNYNCNHIFLGYEIYHGMVGFPDAVLIGLSSSLLLSQSIKNSTKKILFIALSFLLLFYSFFIGRAATTLSIILSIIIFSFIETLKILTTLKMNKAFLTSVFLSILFLILYGEVVIDQALFLYKKLFTTFNESPRVLLYKDYLTSFLQNPRYLFFGGMSKSIGGHNFIISSISILGLFGLTILISSYSIVFSQVTKRIKFNLKNLNSIEIYALILAISSIFVGNTINDSITQPFNTIVIFIYLIFFISILELKNNNIKTIERNES